MGAAVVSLAGLWYWFGVCGCRPGCLTGPIADCCYSTLLLDLQSDKTPLPSANQSAAMPNKMKPTKD